MCRTLIKIALATGAIVLPGVAHTVDTSREERFCAEIGFKATTPEYANCVVDMFGKALPSAVRSSPALPLTADISTSPVQSDGSVVVSVKANRAISSLKLNGVEQGGRADGQYAIRRIALAGTETLYVLSLKDELGNVLERKVSVVRGADQADRLAVGLEPFKLKPAERRDAVAVVIGISNYRRLPKADFADVDGRIFYDYARLALGIPSDNIKLLVNEEGDRTSIRRAIESWLPTVVRRGSTEVFVFYSGHGLPSRNGDKLFLMPWDADRDYLEDTALSQDYLFQVINSSGPRQVSMFLDSCYSGQARSGETLLAGARPVAVHAKQSAVPPNFLLMSASGSDEISSSSPRLKHGIFSFYLMKGLEGDADVNKDGRITAAELFDFVQRSVSQEAAGLGRKQSPVLYGSGAQLIGRTR